MALALRFYHPVGDVPLRRVEVDADFCFGLSAEGEPLAVVLEVYLLHCRLGGLVELQFEEVEVGLGEEPTAEQKASMDKEYAILCHTK